MVKIPAALYCKWLSVILRADDFMNLIRQKMFSLLTETVHNELKTLGPESPLVKELGKIEDIEQIIDEEIEKICNVATMSEITKTVFLVRRLKKDSETEKGLVISELNRIAEGLAKRVETESGPLRLAEVCRNVFSEL